MSGGTEISLIVHTRNSAATLPKLLDSTIWCDERIVVDMSSSDETREIAEGSGCRVIVAPEEPFRDEMRNRYLGRVSHPWTLVLDSDEHLAVDAERVLRSLLSDADENIDGFWIPRFNMIAGRILRGSGWYPDHQLRLFRSGSIVYEAGHHRPPRLRNESRLTVRLDPPGCLHIHHDNYATIADFVERQVRYARTDVYDESHFDFSEYLATAALEYEGRLEPDVDGEHSYALATLMYWNQIIRGLLHWEFLGRTSPLAREAPLFAARTPAPAGDDAEVVRLRAQLAAAEAEIDAMLTSRSFRITRPMRSLARVGRLFRPARVRRAVARRRRTRR